MNIRLVSDLHTELLSITSDSLEDQLESMVPHIKDEQHMVLVLAGDIVANFNYWYGITMLDIYTPWIRELAKRHKAVIYVGGNHEGYNGNIDVVNKYWSFISAMEPNLHFLECDVVIIDDVRFLGTTLWTNIENPLDEIAVRSGMNDYDTISNWSTTKHKFAHKTSVKFLTDYLSMEWSGKTVVVTHHLPSFSSIPEWAKTNDLNSGYASNLDNLISYNDINLWCHGHTHSSCDYTVANTRIVCNPHGYIHNKNDINPNFNGKLVLTV